MKKICQIIFTFITVGLTISSCADIEDAMSTIPELSEPEVLYTTANYYVIGCNISNRNYDISDCYLFVSEHSDMSEATGSPAEWGKSSYTVLSYAVGLSANTTYYAQYVIEYHCLDKDGEYYAKSPVVSFTTSAYDPTPYTINLTNLPTSGSYGVFTVNSNGEGRYERLNGQSTMKPATWIEENSIVCVTCPYIAGANDITSVPLTGGTDFYYAIGEVNPSNPYVKLTPERYTAHVNVSVTFKSAPGVSEPDELWLGEIHMVNVSGNSPLCEKATLNILTGELTSSGVAATCYENGKDEPIKNGTTIKRTFTGVLPVQFGENAVKIVLDFFGDVKEKEVSINLPASTWGAGSDVYVNLSAEYTATGAELNVGSVNVTPWSEGSTGNIDITK